jgi:hypothetical protein
LRRLGNRFADAGNAAPMSAKRQRSLEIRSLHLQSGSRAGIGLCFLQQCHDLSVMNAERPELYVDVSEVVEARSQESGAGRQISDLLFADQVGVDQSGVVIGERRTRPGR